MVEFEVDFIFVEEGVEVIVEGEEVLMEEEVSLVWFLFVLI